MITRIEKSYHHNSWEFYRSVAAFMLLTSFVTMFLYSGFGKCLQYDAYKIYVHQLGFAYEVFTLFALIVPVLEVLVGLLMLVRISRRFALMIGVLHFLIMIAFWLYRWHSDKLVLTDLPRAGLMVNLTIGQHIVQNVVLLLLVFWTLRFEMKQSRMAHTK